MDLRDLILESLLSLLHVVHHGLETLVHVFDRGLGLETTLSLVHVVHRGLKLMRDMLHISGIINWFMVWWRWRWHERWCGCFLRGIRRDLPSDVRSLHCHAIAFHTQVRDIAFFRYGPPADSGYTENCGVVFNLFPYASHFVQCEFPVFEDCLVRHVYGSWYRQWQKNFDTWPEMAD
jgi:hypothetical protein